MRSWQDLKRTKDLKPGDLVRSKFNRGVTYVVLKVNGERATAVTVGDITNSKEWEKYE